jgi:hypothetical protein
MPRRRAILDYQPQTDGAPHRPWSSVNVRRSDKLRYDLLQAWWSMDRGAALAQWDGFSILVATYIEANRHRLPLELRSQLALTGSA